MANRYADHTEIKKLRRRLKMTQTEFGQELYDLDEQTAGNNVSKLERGVIEPSACVRRHLERLEAQEG